MTPEQAAAAMPHVRAAVAAGLLPFPVKLIGGQKKPAYTGWQSKVWDLGLLEQELQNRHCFGYGVTLPRTDPRRLVDLDLDDGGEGLQPGQSPWQERLAAVEQECGALPATKTTDTPSGGQHRWFLWPDDVPLPGGSWHGFTVRMLFGSKNYVVGPGSVRDGKTYVNAAPGTPIATMPPELARSGVKGKVNGALIEIKAPYELPETIDHGDCNAEVCRYTLSLWNRRHSLEEMWTLVLHELGPKLATRHTEEHLRKHFDGATVDLATKYPRDAMGYAIGPPATRIVGPSPSVDERNNPSVNGPSVPAFLSARELVNAAPASVERIAWTCVCGTITELDGKPKSSGKTTLLLHLIRAVLDGAPFLGQPTMATPVVLLTEQSRASIAPTLRALGLDRDELVVLTWPDAFGTPWPAIVAAAVAECERIKARLLIVDTLGQFAGIRGDAENDAGAALEAMAPLQAAAASGLAVLVSRHDRKAGGDVGESGRGSNAWSGAVDCIVALRRPLNPARPTIREIEAISRRGDVPTEPVLIELTEAGYVVLGSETAVAFGEAHAGILGALADREWHAEREIVDELPDASRTTIRDALAILLRDGVVERGKRTRVTEPYPYRLTPVDGAADARQRQETPKTLTLLPSSSPSVDVPITSVNGREETAAPGAWTCDLDVGFDEIAIDS